MWHKCEVMGKSNQVHHWIMQNTRKGWTRDQNIDSYIEISFLGKIYCFYQKRKWSFEKFWFLLHIVEDKKEEIWPSPMTKDHIQYVLQISEQSNEYSMKYGILKLYPTE